MCRAIMTNMKRLVFEAPLTARLCSSLLLLLSAGSLGYGFGVLTETSSETEIRILRNGINSGNSTTESWRAIAEPKARWNSFEKSSAITSLDSGKLKGTTGSGKP